MRLIWLYSYLMPLEVEFLVRVSQKKYSVRNFHQLSSLTRIFKVKKSEIYYSEPRSTTSKNGHIFGQSRNGERKPNNNYNCCVKPILTHEVLRCWIKQSATNDEIF